MDMFVTHGEVRQERNCQCNSPGLDAEKRRDSSRCVVCAAIKCQSVYGDTSDFNAAAVKLLGHIDENVARIGPDFKSNMDVIFEYLEDHGVERKALSHSVQ